MLCSVFIVSDGALQADPDVRTDMEAALNGAYVLVQRLVLCVGSVCASLFFLPCIGRFRSQYTPNNNMLPPPPLVESPSTYTHRVQRNLFIWTQVPHIVQCFTRSICPRAYVVSLIKTATSQPNRNYFHTWAKFSSACPIRSS